MTEHNISLDKITSPIQLLAAWFVALIVLDGAFLTSAGLITSPTWVPIVLVFAAILNVPLFLGCMFFLQTRFRPVVEKLDHQVSGLSVLKDDTIDSTGEFHFGI